MRRSPLERRTPLTGKAGLKRTAALNASPLARSSLHADSAERRRLPKRTTAKNTGPSAKAVALVWARDEGCCVRCGQPCVSSERGVGWSIQHRRARGMGGTSRPDANSPQNLIVLCGSATTFCHGWVESMRADALSNGWAVKSNSDPLSIPVVYRGAVRWLLDDGSVSPTDPTEEVTVPNYIQTVEDSLKRNALNVLSDGQARMYALLVLTRGTRTTLEDVHHAWAVDRNVDRPDHQDIVPFGELPAHVAEWDRPFMELIHKVAAELPVAA